MTGGPSRSYELFVKAYGKVITPCSRNVIVATNSRADVILDKDRKWQEGFEVGIVFLLMLQRCPELQGTYASINEEQLFLFASQLEYDVEWKKRSNGKTWMRFRYRGETETESD